MSHFIRHSIDFSGPVSHAAITPIAPVSLQAKPYAEPLHAAPIHSEPLYNEASQPFESTLVGKAAYGSYGAYTPALSVPLMANAYETPILKSAYVPEEYAASEYVPVLAHGQYGARTGLYGKPYAGYY